MPKPGFVFSNVCYNDTAFFTDTSTIDSTVIKDYIWEFGDGQTDTLPTTKYTYLYADTFSVKQKLISDMGCADSISQDIVIFPRPIAKIITADVCQNDTVVLYDSTQTTTDYLVQRQWWEATVYIDSNSLQKWLPVDTGFHSITLWVENNLGCTDTQLVVVDVYSNPKAAFSFQDVCFIDTAQFNDESTIDEGSIVQWLWAFDDGGASTQQNPQKKYNTPSNYAPQLLVTSNKGCSNGITGSVNAYDMPDVKFDINDVCVYDTAFFTDFSTIKHGTQTDRLWDFGDGTLDTATVPEHKYNLLGSYTVRLIVEVSGLCVDSGEKLITIFPRPRAGFTFQDDCVKQIIEIEDASTVNFGSIVYQEWDLSNRLDTGKKVNSIYFVEGSKTIQLIASSQFGCRDTVYKTLTVFPEPKVAFSASEVCLRDTTQFTSNVTLSSGVVTSYNWDYNDASNDTGKAPKHLYQNWGDYSVELTATSDKGCINSFKSPIRVNPLPRAGIFTPDPDKCEPFEVPFTSISTVGEGAILNWDWKFGDNRVSNEPHPTHTYQSFGVYSPYLKVITDKGCVHDSTFVNYITVYQLPVADFTATPKEVTFFDPVINFTDKSSSDVVNWDWEFGDGQISGVPNPVITYDDTGKYIVEL